MVKLGYMLPTDETHDNKARELAHYHQVAEETVINMLIDNAYKEFNGIKSSEITFNKEELALISHGLYQAFSHMGRNLTNYEKEYKNEAQILQRKVNREFASLIGAKK